MEAVMPLCEVAVGDVDEANDDDGEDEDGSEVVDVEGDEDDDSATGGGMGYEPAGQAVPSMMILSKSVSIMSSVLPKTLIHRGGARQYPSPAEGDKRVYSHFPTMTVYASSGT